MGQFPTGQVTSLDNRRIGIRRCLVGATFIVAPSVTSEFAIYVKHPYCPCSACTGDPGMEAEGVGLTVVTEI
jgi:hypothetical protein